MEQDKQRDMCLARLKGGTHVELAAEFECCEATVARILKENKVKAPPRKPRARKPAAATGSQIKLFASRVRSILWRQDREKYNEWSNRVAWLSSKEGGDYTESQAVIRASKEFPALELLFREYDVSEFDPNPESHPRIVHPSPGGITNYDSIECEDVKQSYRDSLRWAMDAAGAKLRSGELPEKCPNDIAFYLFRQAIEEPKDFMQKVSQMELKVDRDDEDRQNFRKDARKSVAEIDDYLEELELEEKRIEQDEEEDREAKQEEP